MMYRFVFPAGWSAPMTALQYEKACAIAAQYRMTSTVEVEPVFGVPGAVLLNTGTISIAILPDGSSHS